MMDNREKRRIEMFKRVRDFGANRAADFTAKSPGEELFFATGNTGSPGRPQANAKAASSHPKGFASLNPCRSRANANRYISFPVLREGTGSG